MPDPPKNVLITRDVEGPDDEDGWGFAARHPDLAYVFGPTVRGLFVVGCLALDLLGPLQVLQLIADQELAALPLLVLAVAGLAYLEYRTYRRLWQHPRRREAVAVAGVRRI